VWGLNSRSAYDSKIRRKIRITKISRIHVCDTLVRSTLTSYMTFYSVINCAKLGADRLGNQRLLLHGPAGTGNRLFSHLTRILLKTQCIVRCRAYTRNNVHYMWNAGGTLSPSICMVSGGCYPPWCPSAVLVEIQQRFKRVSYLQLALDRCSVRARFNKSIVIILFVQHH
jgi:hypothetical protein